MEKARLAVEDAKAALVAAGLPLVDGFEHVAREWFSTRRGEWAPNHVRTH